MDTEKDFNLIPSYTYKFYLSDFIEIVLIIQKKVEDVSLPMLDLLEAAKRIPINMQGVIAIAYRKAIIQEATDIIISFFLSKKEDELAIQSIFDSETHQYILTFFGLLLTIKLILGLIVV